MGRHPKNALALIPTGDGGWRLTGRILGNRIRKRGPNYDELQALKVKLEKQLVGKAQLTQELRHTWLTADQLRDAEAAVGRAGDRSLLHCVLTAEGVLGTGEAVKSAVALQDWLAALAERKRSKLTIGKNRLRVEDFLRHCGVTWLHEITDHMVERWIYRKGLADFTRVTDAAVLRAWLTWCVKRRKIGRSPFEVDMKDLLATARPVERPKILTPEQCWALLTAAEGHAGGRLVPYVILSTWCFMRPGEVTRTTREQLRLEGERPVVETWPLKRGTVSYRTVDVPACVIERLKGWKSSAALPVRRRKGKARHLRGITKVMEERVYYSKGMWETVRAKAGLIKLSKVGRHKRRKIMDGVWQADILRHTGISYHYQRGGDIKETCRQAGNSSDVSFRHYLQLPGQGAAAAFYAAERSTSNAQHPTSK